MNTYLDLLEKVTLGRVGSFKVGVAVKDFFTKMESESV